ncbi:helix-turn-helix domain-containing protein [bacterium]|nr:helix-turn-helix domain-containing protein [bacterium]
MSNREIKALIVLNGTSLSAIARSARVSRQWVSMVVNGHKKSRRIRKAIAAAVGKEVEDLWPNGNNKAA